jgi:Family of unknown function (DUF5677)
LALGSSKGEKQLKNSTDLLRKRADDAEELFRRCELLAKDPGGIDFAPLALFLHMMRMADGIFILAEAMSSAPMFPLLRSMVESHFSLQYIIGQQSKSEDVEKRSLAWLVFCINQDIALDDMIDPSTTSGKTFKAELKAGCGAIGEEICNHLDRKVYPQHGSRPLQERLEEPDLVNLQQEFKKRKSKPRYFFELVDPNIPGIEGLARQIGQWPEYKVFYSPFSHTVHGTDPLRLLEVKGEGDVRFGVLRTTDEQEFLVDLAEAVLHMAGSALAKHYFPELSNSRQNR